MKYRIKEEITVSGVHIYTPQYKKFLFWKCWTYSPGIDCIAIRKYDTLSEAKDFIDRHLFREMEKLGRTIIETNIIDYT